MRLILLGVVAPLLCVAPASAQDLRLHRVEARVTPSGEWARFDELPDPFVNPPRNAEGCAQILAALRSVERDPRLEFPCVPSVQR